MRRRFQSDMRSRIPLILILFFSFPFLTQAEVLRTIPAECSKKAGQLQVDYNGRICPLQTFARDFTAALYGDTHYQKYSAEQVLFGWLLFFDDWYRHSTLTFTDRTEQQEQLRIIATLHAGHLLHIFPATDSAGNIRWYSRNDSLPKLLSTQEQLFIRKSDQYLSHLVETNDIQTLNNTFNQISKYQQKRAQGQSLSKQKLRGELLYNKLSPRMVVPIITLCFGFLFFLALLFHELKGYRNWHLFKVSGFIVILCAVLYLLILFLLQWYVTGQLPLNNGYDTLMFIALCSVLIALFSIKRSNRLIPFGLLIAGFATLVAVLVQRAHTIALRSTALDSPLLGIHVSIIMISYTLFAFITFNASAALISKGIFRGRQLDVGQRLHCESQKLLYPALSFLATGIVIGSIWAKQAWGSYWSWDPKETWALITLLLYGVLLLTGRKKRRHFSPDRYHIFAIICFISVLITYFGVNYLFGGLHSYAR